MTTVGYGDISPKTSFGRIIAALVMIMGYAVMCVPGTFACIELATNELIDLPDNVKKRVLFCDECNIIDHDEDARFCHMCAKVLDKVGANDARARVLSSAGRSGSVVTPPKNLLDNIDDKSPLMSTDEDGGIMLK